MLHRHQPCSTPLQCPVLGGRSPQWSLQWRGWSFLNEKICQSLSWRALRCVKWRSRRNALKLCYVIVWSALQLATNDSTIQQCLNLRVHTIPELLQSLFLHFCLSKYCSNFNLKMNTAVPSYCLEARPNVIWGLNERKYQQITWWPFVTSQHITTNQFYSKVLPSSYFTKRVA